MADTLTPFTYTWCRTGCCRNVPGNALGKYQELQGARRLQQVQDYVCAATLDRFDASGVFQPASALAELSGTSSAGYLTQHVNWRSNHGSTQAYKAFLGRGAQHITQRQQRIACA